MLKKRRAFGLIETLIVIVIIAVLALILIPRLTGAGKTPEEQRKTPIGRAKTTAGAEYTAQIAQAIMMYKQDNDDTLPPTLQALKPYGVTDEMLLDQVTKQPLAYNPQTGTVGAAAQVAAPGAATAPIGAPPRQNVGPGGVSLPNIPQAPVDAGGDE
ncbi:MAG: type II secretion system protein [Armatimonadetes bacterium]|nr:type II secretion system protein [Armatimonadota bacterium]